MASSNYLDERAFPYGAAKIEVFHKDAKAKKDPSIALAFCPFGS
jgi:hypothetical protein